MTSGPLKAEIELPQSRLTRLANRTFTSAGFMDRTVMARQIPLMASLPQANEILASKGILKLRVEDKSLDQVQVRDISNIITERTWNSALAELGMIPIETDHVVVKERAIDVISDNLLGLKRTAYSAALRVDSALDKAAEAINPDLKRMDAIYEHGIRSAEDMEIIARANGSAGHSNVALMGALALGSVAAIGIASVFSVTIPMGAAFTALGMTGAFALKSCPAFREKVAAVLKNSLPVIVGALMMFVGKDYLGLQGKEFMTALFGLGAMATTYVAGGIHDTIKQRIRIGQLARESAPLYVKQRYLFEILENLYKVKDSKPQRTNKYSDEAKNCISNLKEKVKGESHLSADDIKHIIERADLALQALAAADQRKQIESALAPLTADLDEIKIPDFHLPYQPLIVSTKLAKVFNLLFFLTLHPVFFTKAHGPFESMLFAGFYLASAFYTFGALSYMGTVEQTERVDALKFPKVSDNKQERAKLMMFRYTAPGGFMNENPLECLVQDIYARIKYGAYKVIFRNAAAWTCKGQTYGFIKTAHIFEGRIKKIRGIIDQITSLSHLSVDAKDHLAFSLSVEERAWLAHRTMDDVANEAYENAAPEGQVVRFRDSIGRWHGEKVTYEALKALFADRLDEAVSDPALRVKYRKVLNNLKDAVIDQRDITLDNLHVAPAVASAIRRMDKNSTLTDDEINTLVDTVIVPYREEYLAKALRYFAIEAGIDTKRAYVISRKAALRLASERRTDPIAKLGKELILLGSRMEKKDLDDLVALLTEEYEISEQSARTLTQAVAAGNVQEEAKGMARIYREDVDLYYRLRDQYEFGRAVEAGEDGNISKAILWLANQDPAAPLTPGQAEFKTFLAEFKGWAPAKFKKLLEAFEKNTGIKRDKFTDVQWAQFLEFVLMTDKERTPAASGNTTAINIAKKIEYSAYVRGFEGLDGKSPGGRANKSRTLAEEVCVALAPKRKFGKDWAAEVKAMRQADPNLGIEGAQYLVWKKWKEEVEPIVSEVASRHVLTQVESDFIWEMVETELDRNYREVNAGTLGMYQLMSHEIDGVQKISAVMVRDFGDPASKIRKHIESAANHKEEKKLLAAQLVKSIVIPDTARAKVANLAGKVFTPLNGLPALVTDAKKQESLIDEILKIKSAKELKKTPKLMDKIRKDFGDAVTDLLMNNRTLFDLAAIVGKDGIKELFKAMSGAKTIDEAVEAIIKSLKKQIADQILKEITGLIGKGLGGKGKPSTKGWIKSFREMSTLIPRILLNGNKGKPGTKGFGKALPKVSALASRILDRDEAITVEFGGETYEMTGTSVVKYQANLSFAGAAKLLEDIVIADGKVYEEGIKIREWLVSQIEADPAPGERGRLIEKDSLKSFGDKVVGIAKTGLTAAELQTELAKIPADVMTAHMTPGNYMTLSKKKLADLLKDISGGVKAGTIARRTGESLEVTHYFSQKVGHLDYTAAKAALTNVALLGSSVGEQLGVFIRYSIKRFFEEKGGQTRIPVKIHNWIKDDVVRQLRLHSDEDLDFKAKLERGITPDDIARRLIDLIHGRKMTAKQAASEVFKAFKISETESVITMNYCEGQLSDIRANLVDIADEIAVSVYASQALGIVAAHYAVANKKLDLNDTTGIPQIAVDDYIEPLRQNGKNGAGSATVIKRFLATQKHLSLRQKNQIIELAMDLGRKLDADKKKKEHEKLYSRYEWYTIPALWTPKDKQNGAKQFLLLENGRHELIIPRPRTMEEIVAWSISQQGMTEYELDEGRILEFAIMARKIARIADRTNFTAPRAIAKIFDYTEDHRTEIKTRQEEFISQLSATLGQAEESGQEVAGVGTVFNYLDDRRFERTYFEREGSDFHGNWDLDNITSTRFPFLSSHFGYHHGILVYRGDAILQFGNNYEYQGMGTLIRAQQDKDTTLRDNMWLARGQKAPRGIVRHRHKRLRKTAFPIGYANMMPIDAVMECVKTIEAVNFTMRDNGTYDELIYGKVAKSKFYGALKRASMLIPVLGAVYAAGMGLLSTIPGLSGWQPALMVAVAGVAAAKALKLPVIPSIFATYYGVAHLAPHLGMPAEWFAGHGFWDFAAYASLGNLFIFNLMPRAGSAIAKRKLQLSEYIHTRILYNILRIVEDSATGVAMLSKDFQAAGSKGAVQWNDAVVDLGVLFGQWDRWFGGNAEYIREFLRDFYRERQSLTFSQWLDLFACYTYPMSSLATDINRYGLMFLTMFWMTALSFVNSEISSSLVLPHIGWLPLLGLLAWKTSMTAFKMSRHHEGAQKMELSETLSGLRKLLNRDTEGLAYGLGAVNRHIPTETIAQPAISRGVMVKFISDDRSAFLVTKNKVRPQLWDKAANALMNKNLFWLAGLSYAGYKVIRNNLITDFVNYGDFSSLPMGIVGFWIVYEWQKLLLGEIIVRFGNQSDDWQRKWEKRNGKKMLDLVKKTPS